VNRTDRLYAIVEELRARSPRVLTAAELADRFEVGRRTIERDISALQQAGVPIWTQRGRAGGYAIDAAMTLPPVNLSSDEALAVVAALSSMPTMPFAAAGRRAQQKLLAAMRDADADAARDLASRLRLSPVESPAVRPDVLAAVETAVAGRRVVELRYTDSHEQRSTRAVEAHGLHLAANGWYLVGWCRLRDDGRVFRLDRIEHATVTDETAPPRDLDAVLDVPFPTITPDIAE
jgi:predicted DNA-binding transcriptional regulator YafY